MRLFVIIFLLHFFSNSLKSQITPVFNSNTNEICAPGFIQLFDSSSSSVGTIIDWEWQQNGLVFSKLKNPAFFLNNPGTYTICLKVTDNLGNSDSLCINNYIIGYQSPTANFSVDKLLGCRPLSTNFSDLSLLGDAPIQQWRWDFGDGVIDTIHQHANHLYNTVGNFNLTLVVTDSNGCSSSLLKPNLITIVDSVTAAIGHNAQQVQCGLPSMVTFTGLSNGPAYNYTWYFDDNTSASGANIVHHYLGSGCFSPTLVVGNGLCSASATVASCITISDNPTASFTIANPTACALPYAPLINNQSLGQTSNHWYFGDGFTSNLQQPPSHFFTSYYPIDSANYENGVFPIVLTVSNSLGCTDRDTQLVYISKLHTSIIAPYPICAPDNATLIASSSNISSIFYSTNWAWTVDNWVSTNDSLVTVSYPDSGYYNAHLITTDNIGCKDTTSYTIRVGITPSIDTITIDTNYICRMTGIVFTALGSSFIDIWKWSFSDGSSGNQSTFQHFFQDTGFISGRVIVDFRGCIDTVALDGYYIMPPIAKFSPDIICDSFLVRFMDESVGGHRWFWDFGDTTSLADTSNLQYPSYVYPNSGDYWVVLTVWNDSSNCVDSFRQQITMGTSISNFTIPDSLCTVAIFSPVNQSINAAAYQWSAPGAEPFDNKEKTPTFIFNQPGIYNIQLSAIDANDCVDTFSRLIHIAGIDTNITYNPVPACRPAIVHFVDSTLGVLSPIVSWQWGNGGNQQNTAQTYSFPGSQNMNLTVTNDWACTFPLVKKVDIGGLFLNFTSSRDVCIGNSYTAVAIVSSPSNAGAFKPYTFVWDFGDGHRDTSFSNIINYSYPNPGIYSVCLYIIDSIGCVSTLCRPDWVTVHDPNALFTVDTFYSSCPPLEVNFSNLSLSGTQWVWDFGDGSISNLKEPSHIYSTPGFYDISLSVSAFPGCFSSKTISQMIQITGPSGSFSMQPANHCAPYTAQFIATGSHVANYTWLFGNGDSHTNLSNAAADTVYYNYTEAGIFLPTLIIDDGIGCQVPIEGDTIIIKAAPKPSFSADSILCQLDSISYQLHNSLVGNMSVEWFFEGGFPASSTDAQATIYYPDTGVFDVMLILWKDNCSDTLFKKDYIAVKSLPLANFAIGLLDSCAPVLASFSDSSTSEQGFIQSWWWDFGNGQTATQQDTALWYDLADTFVISLIVESNFGCRDSVYHILKSYPSPSVDIGTYPPLCVGDTLELQGFGTGSFLWTSNNWLSDSSIYNPLTVLDSAQYYHLEVQNNYGCKAMDSLYILATPSLIVDAGDSLFICLGDSILLNASGNTNSFDWGIEPSLSCQFCTNPIAKPSVSHTYYLQADSFSSCNNVDSLVLIVHSLPIAQLSANSGICLGDSLQLIASGGLTYHWLGANLSDSSIYNPWAKPTSSGLYSVEIHDSNNCKDSTSIFISIFNNNNTPLSDQTICLGDSIILSLDRGSNPTWLGNNLSCNNCFQPTAVPSNSSLYFVSYYDNNNCFVKDSLSVDVVSPPFIQLDSILTATLGTTIVLNSYADPSSTFNWSPSEDLSCSHCPNPSWLVDGNKIFYITVSDIFGCYTSDSIIINFHSDCNSNSVFVPNAFSPDGDGHNDLLVAQSGSIQEIKVFQIYNRWGQLVFETKDMLQAWDGTFQGKPSSPDVYAYYLVFKCPNTSEEILKKGNITILR